MHVQLAQHDRDPLTGLPGYDAFLKDVEAASESAEISGRSVSIALVDIDEFGVVNAAIGKSAGDQAIAGLAQALVGFAGEDGMVYRYGGDAFTILFDGTEKERAFLRMENARKAFEGKQVAEGGKGSVRFPLTISVGVAALPDDGMKAPDLIRKCSEALYRAKVSGRNKVSLAREKKMVTKTTHYTQGQLEGLSRLAKREGLNEATLLREALDDLLRKRNS
ncbi:MAG: GGDEF domain-containing protein [Candidatus Hydrogenedentes bacterium]|nr:GGDEF domain-containing protein [Candidatus Hydrogenedentota bacterium]